MRPLMNQEHRFRFNNPNWRDYRSGKTSAPPPPPPPPLVPPPVNPPPLPCLTRRPPPPHHSRVISKKKEGDLTANLAQGRPAESGPEHDSQNSSLQLTPLRPPPLSVCGVGGRERLPSFQQVRWVGGRGRGGGGGGRLSGP